MYIHAKFREAGGPAGPLSPPVSGKPKARLTLRASQTEFALMIGVNVSTLRNWEQGRRVHEGAGPRPPSCRVEEPGRGRPGAPRVARCGVTSGVGSRATMAVMASSGEGSLG